VLHRVPKNVGIASAMHAPFPGFSAEQISASLADPGDAMLRSAEFRTMVASDPRRHRQRAAVA
jgi:hypothetical protein